MVGCGGDDEDDPPPDKPVEIVTPPPPPPVETPMEKLTGTYAFIEAEGVNAFFEVLEPPDSGKLHLRPGGNGWLVTLLQDGDAFGNSGATWSANATTLTLTASDGERLVNDYTLEGQVLTLTQFGEDGGTIQKWRKD